MILELTQLEHGRVEASFRILPGSPVLEGFGGEVREPIDLEVCARHPSGDTYVVEVVLAGAVTRPCRRCLVPVEVDFEDRFRIVYQVADREEDTGDDDVILLEPGNVRIDFTEPVRDRLFLEVDLYPLCRPECAGFCTRCGQNLNEGSCDCEPEPEPGESRWAALEAIRERVGGGT
jgi:uncharacterized protein